MMAGQVITNQTAESPIIETASGSLFNLEHPDPVIISIDDIATGLANTCRFNGQISDDKYYSVAEHSVVCAKVAAHHGYSQAQIMACLMHDAAEAYVGDVVTPFKKKLDPLYQNFETVVECAIEIRFGINFELHKQATKAIDDAVFNAECIALGRRAANYDQDLRLNLRCWERQQARKEFLRYYLEISGNFPKS